MYTEEWDNIPFEHDYPIHEIRLMKGGCWAAKALMNVMFDRKSRVFTRYVRKQIKGKEYNLVFCTTFSTFPLATALRIALERQLPLFVDIRDLDEQVPGAQYQHHRAWWTYPFRNMYRALQIRRRNRVLRRADYITTVSPWHIEFLKAINPNVHLIYNGFAPQQFYPEDIRTDEFLVSYIGRLYEFQDLHILQECLDELGLPDMRLNLHMPDNNPISIEEVGDEIRRSSVMVVLTNREAKGMMTTKFFEALGCEKPVLCIPNDEGVLANAIAETQAGLASDNKEEIKAFLLYKYKEWKANGYTRQAVKMQAKQLFSRKEQAIAFEQRMVQTVAPLISVVVPVYNADKYLKQCLQSIAEQTYRNLQVVVIDDGSTDESLRIAQEFAKHDARFVVLHQTNSGQSEARNKAMEYATGDYVAFVDADDWIEPDYLATMLKAAYSNEIVQCGYRRVREDNTTVETKVPRHLYQFTVPWGRLYRRHVLDGIVFPEKMIYEDVIFSLRLWSKRPSTVIIPYTGYNYRLNEASTTAQADQLAQERLFSTLRATKAPWWLKLYTIIRLKIHFRR